MPLPLDAKAWETLEGVNTATNLAITPKADLVHYGLDEYWTIPADGYGDCDDYVLAKRSALIARGIPESALRIAIVFTPRFIRHTVLIVSTDKGTFVLDNLRNEIMSWDKAEYGWIKCQDPASRSGWAYF
jgi:predicted transglutaminase-like cysteine proteinase